MTTESIDEQQMIRPDEADPGVGTSNALGLDVKIWLT